MSEHENTTQLLRNWQAGDERARDKLFDMVYENLHSIARGVLRVDRQRRVFQATELVNECALRMLGLNALEWRDRAHFIAVASVTMRRVLVDEARRKNANKRDGVEVTLVTRADKAEHNQSLDIEALDQALIRLSDVDPAFTRVVELKYFGGMTNEEVAEVECTSVSTVKRNWRAARAFLFDELQAGA